MSVKFVHEQDVIAQKRRTKMC